MSQPPPPDSPPFSPQYPPPYPPQGDGGYQPQYNFLSYYMTPPQTLLAPARRASIMLFVLAAISLLLSTCIGASALESTDAILNETIDNMRRINPEAAAPYTPQLLRAMQAVIATLMGIAAAVAIVLGIVVRSGSRAATITALVVVLLPAIGIVLLLLGTLIGGPSAFLTGVLVLLLPAVLVAMTISSLISAIRAAAHVEAARHHMMMAHQQQQAQYYAQYQAYQMPPPPTGPPPQG